MTSSHRDNHNREVTKQIRIHRSELTKRPSRTTACQPGGTRRDRETLKVGNDSQEAAAPPACIWDGLCLTPADRARGEGALLMRLRNPSLGWGTFLKGCLCDTVPQRCQPWNLWSTQINTHTHFLFTGHEVTVLLTDWTGGRKLTWEINSRQNHWTFSCVLTSQLLRTLTHYLKHKISQVHCMQISLNYV